jgi:hypothetical protein
MVWILMTGAFDRRSGSERPMVPATTLGRVAVASLLLMILVAVADAIPAVTIPVGTTMLALSASARWGQCDRGLLLAFPLVFGSWVLVLPLLFE